MDADCERYTRRTTKLHSAREDDVCHRIRVRRIGLRIQRFIHKLAYLTLQQRRLHHRSSPFASLVVQIVSHHLMKCLASRHLTPVSQLRCDMPSTPFTPLRLVGSCLNVGS